jgi:hypothetical protein
MTGYKYLYMSESRIELQMELQLAWLYLTSSVTKHMAVGILIQLIIESNTPPHLT